MCLLVKIGREGLELRSAISCYRRGLLMFKGLVYKVCSMVSCTGLGNALDQFFHKANDFFTSKSNLKFSSEQNFLEGGSAKNVDF